MARIGLRGKTMCLYLPLDVADFAENKYHLEDVSDILANVDAPAMYRLKNHRRVKYSADLTATVTERPGLARIERIDEDFYVPYEGTVYLIKRGLIKRKIKSIAEEAEFLRTNPQMN